MNPCSCGKPFVAQLPGMMTLVGYYSPPGHGHDDNCRTMYLFCEDKHATAIVIRNKCATKGCYWVGKATCWCHPGEKVDSPSLPAMKMTYEEFTKVLTETRR